MADGAKLEFADLLAGVLEGKGTCVVYRHKPDERMDGDFAKHLVELAIEDPPVLEAYQAVQTDQTRKRFAKADILAIFAASDGSDGVFLGLYKVHPMAQVSRSEYERSEPAQKLLRLMGRHSFTDDPYFADDETVKELHVPNRQMSEAKGWIGRVRVRFNSVRGAQYLANISLPIVSISENPLGVRDLDWRENSYRHSDLGSLTEAEKGRLRGLRAVYLALDEESGARYVGKADGRENLLQRWTAYHQTVDGGNVHLKGLDPDKLRYSVLQEVGPRDDIDAIESSWKKRLFSRRYVPGVTAGNRLGLNAN